MPANANRPRAAHPGSDTSGGSRLDDHDTEGVRHPLRPVDVEKAVKAAGIVELALAVPATNDIKREAWAGRRSEAASAASFPCPACQLHARDKTVLPFVGTTLPLGGQVVDSVRWECCLCGAEGTRWTLEQLVLTRLEVLQHFLERQGLTT